MHTRIFIHTQSFTALNKNFPKLVHELQSLNIAILPHKTELFLNYQPKDNTEMMTYLISPHYLSYQGNPYKLQFIRCKDDNLQFLGFIFTVISRAEKYRLEKNKT